MKKSLRALYNMESKINNLKNLGKDSLIPLEPDDNILEKVNNPKIGVMYSVRFICPEFTSLCPVTGQPDFGHLIIDYIPCLLYTSPSPRDGLLSRMPSSA